MTDSGIRDESRDRHRGRNADLRAQVDDMLGALQTQTEALAAAQGTVAGLTATAESPDGLVRVTVDAAGAVRSVSIAPAAFGRTTTERLAASVTAAAVAATADVRAQVAELLAPVTAAAASMPDLSDIVSGAPSLRNLVPTVATEFTPADIVDDLHDWRAPILREAHRG
ncbi:YbaB/EbfC family nucleoid-associated protein [Prescottella subtropica]|uniref:YbaB/EbfC family nucleoid-associated protein n=1 Tax=Prescottella subtropica TaxID=2545757 RepID=UPI0010F9589B|nr:YbaB/EbfC family nucleoid-associated protein [Prescottella subtropica]